MTSPRPETTRPGEPEQQKRSQLSAVQVAASALAAVSSAVVASFFGVAGTLIGAAVASVIATVGTALYTESLSKTNDRLRRLVTTRERPRTTPAPEPATRTLPSHLDPRQSPARRRGLRWSRVAGYAVAVFVVAMGIVTGIELIGQKPVSALVGHSSGSRTTTIGELAEASSRRDTTPTTPSTPATTAPATPSETAPSEPTPTVEQETSRAPSTTPSGSSAPEPTAPATPAPGTSQAPADGTAPTP